MRRVDRISAAVYSASGLMAALIPGLFVVRIHGHHLHGLLREVLPALAG